MLGFISEVAKRVVSWVVEFYWAARVASIVVLLEVMFAVVN